MAYKIQYGPQLRKARWSRILFFTMILICGVLLRITGADAAIWHSLLPGDPELTGPAIRTFMETVAEGDDLQAAFRQLCIQILEDAQIY